MRQLAALVNMPEAPMHKDYLAVPGQYDIWTARKLLDRKTITVAETK
jgi:hypothetical protein